MIRGLIALFLTLFSGVVAHPHGEMTPLYQKYQQAAKSRPQNFPKTKEIAMPTKKDRNLAGVYNKSLFVPPLPGQNGVDYHPQLKKLPTEDTTITYYSWHVHVYFFHEDQNVTDRTLALRDQFIKTFSLAKCDDECFMGGPFDTCNQGMCVWDPFYGVDGPHPYGQWGVYMPNEYLAETMAWFSMNHGEFDVLFHPNTGYMVGDHDQDKRAIWIKQMVPLDIDFLVWLQCEWYGCSDEVTLKKVKY